MPRLDIIQTKDRITPTPPAEIPYPEYLGSQAYGGLQQLGASLAKIGNAFLSEILEANINKEIAETWGAIEKQHYSHLQKDESNPEIYVSQHRELIDNWHDLVSQQKTRGAKAVLNNRLATQVWGWHSQVVDKARLQLRQNAIDSYAIIKEDKKDLFAVPQVDEETDKVETFEEAIKRTISDAELDIETAGQKIIAGSPVRENNARQADIDEVKIHIVANSIYNAFPDRVEGHNWLKKNYKKLGLSVSEFNLVGGLLNNVWKNDEAVAKMQQEQQIEQTTEQIWNAIDKEDFQTARLLVDSSNLPVGGTGGKRFWSEYIDTKMNKVLTGEDAIDDPQTVYEINNIIDDLWLGEKNWNELRFALVKGEVTNKLKSNTKNKLLDEAKIKLNEQQKREWTAIKTEAKSAIVLVPGPEDIDFAAFRSGMREEEKEEADKKHREQIFRFNEFRKDFIEWMNKNPEATFYEYQERRLELLYGKYTTVDDELLKKRVEAALQFDVGEERTVDGEVYVYLGGDKWRKKQ